jgi:hypothetical protein
MLVNQSFISQVLYTENVCLTLGSILMFLHMVNSCISSEEMQYIYIVDYLWYDNNVNYILPL